MKNAVRRLTQEMTRVTTLELSTLEMKPSIKMSRSCLVALSRLYSVCAVCSQEREVCSRLESSVNTRDSTVGSSSWLDMRRLRSPTVTPTLLTLQQPILWVL